MNETTQRRESNSKLRTSLTAVLLASIASPALLAVLQAEMNPRNSSHWPIIALETLIYVATTALVVHPLLAVSRGFLRRSTGILILAAGVFGWFASLIVATWLFVYVELWMLLPMLGLLLGSIATLIGSRTSPQVSNAASPVPEGSTR